YLNLEHQLQYQHQEQETLLLILFLFFSLLREHFHDSNYYQVLINKHIPSHINFLALLKKTRSEEHTSELQSRFDLVCRLLLAKKKTNRNISITSHTVHG